jgi:hypothetical protein
MPFITTDRSSYVEVNRVKFFRNLESRYGLKTVENGKESETESTTSS